MDAETSKRITLLLERLVKQFFNGTAPENVKKYILNIASSRIGLPVLKENAIKEEALAGLLPDQAEKYKKLFFRLIRLKAVSKRVQILHILNKIKNFSQISSKSEEKPQDSALDQPRVRPETVSRKEKKMILMEREIISDILKILQEKSPDFFEIDKNDEFRMEKFKILRPFDRMTAEMLEMFHLQQRVKKFVKSEHLSFTEKLISGFFEEELEKYQGFLNELIGQQMNLRKMHYWMKDPIEKMTFFVVLIDSIDGLKGGQILSVVYNLSNQGNNKVKALMNEIFKFSSEKIKEMIENWCVLGTIDDPFNEFLIFEDISIDADSLWTKKYQIVHEMVPCFFSEPLTKNLLKIGKNINFIKFACSEPWTSSSSLFPSINDSTALESWVGNQVSLTGQFLISLIKIKYNLDDHFSCLKKYILLAQGDFSQSLMFRIHEILSQSGSSVFKHDTNISLGLAIRDSSARHELSDCINRLDTKILEPSPLDTGWDLFILDYVFSAPLTTIFSPSCTETYSRAFKFLWHLKRAEYLCNQYTFPREVLFYQNYYELRGVFHRFQLFKHEINHFISNFLSYLIVEVVESSWKVFRKKMEQAEGLDELIEIHEIFLNDVSTKAFLDDEEMYKRVLGLVEIVVRFCDMFNDLIKAAGEERFRREVEIRCGNLEEIRIFDEMNCDVDLLKEQFLDEFREFRKKLTGSVFQRFLAFRLDFNEFYEI
jgi:gamma-tubulin complex component 3